MPASPAVMGGSGSKRDRAPSGASQEASATATQAKRGKNSPEKIKTSPEKIKTSPNRIKTSPDRDPARGKGKAKRKPSARPRGARRTNRGRLQLVCEFQEKYGAQVLCVSLTGALQLPPMGTDGHASPRAKMYAPPFPPISHPCCTHIRGRPLSSSCLPMNMAFLWYLVVSHAAALSA